MSCIIYSLSIANHVDQLNTIFKQNTRRRTLKSGNLIIRCKRGLWSCEGLDHVKVEREAMHYFLQYYKDGEYN